MQLPDVEAFYPLSPMQQGMLFHTLSAPRSAMYWQQATLTLEGDLDRATLLRAWQGVVDRHAALRTYFVWQELKEPVQVVERERRLPVEEHDWSGVDAERQAAQLEALLAADRARGCDLSRPPLQRLAVVRLAERLHHVIWSFHHILLDGWSVYRVWKDVFEAYEALRQGRESEPPAIRPYQDFIVWLRRQDTRRAREFWSEEMAGFTVPTSLQEAVAVPGAAPREGIEVATGTIRLDEVVSAELQALARRHQLTLNTLLQGAWALLLGRYSGRQDVCFGATVSGRPADLEGADAMVGMLINTLPVRVRVDEDARALDWLRRLQARQAEARQYDWTPLVEVHGWSGVPRDVPLFDGIFIFANYPVELWSSLCQGSLRVRSYRAEESTNYTVNAFAEPGPRLSLGVFYDSLRCQPQAIERLLSHWRALLEGILARPDARVAELSLLGSEERDQLQAWNASRREYARGSLLPDLVEVQAARSPQAVAVACGAEQLTYAELNARANVLAGELGRLGVRPGVLVGIHLERSLEMLVCLLGVLKSGGAYVPMDPSYPTERLEYMLEDSGAAVLLTQTGLAGRLPSHGARVLCVDAGYAAGAEAGANPVRRGSAEDLAYVIYTSGSTGRPKGVGVTHRSLVNFLESMRQEPGMTGSDVMLSVTTLSFDIAGLELYLPLLAGGRVALASREEASDGERLMKRLSESGATLMQATPATWRLLLEAGWSGDSGLKVLCGGEALTRELAERLLERGSSVWNLYGPTETTIWSTLWKVEADGPVTVGRPIANTSVYVLDARGRQVPVGVAGELCIGGEGLARGYWRRPELTAERFVPDPYGEPGSRMYRTGDLARFLADGRLEWHSRLDHQVKLRGFRIELGEIESVLSRHADVRQAVALAREDVAGDARLVGYVVRESDAAGAEQAQLSARLRSHLLERLPDYMVPTGWVFLDAFPLTPNGKVDRKALPKPEAQGASGYVAPETAADRAIAEVWQDVLRVERVGMHDNFFDLGGHSLLVMQVQGKLRRLLEREVPIVDLFRHPTVASLGRHLRNGEDDRPDDTEDETIEKLQVGRQRLNRQHQRRRQQAGEGR